MNFECCAKCKPPRRGGDCHCHCVDYAIDKAFHEAQRCERNAKQEAASGLTAQFIAGVERANKRRKGQK